MQLAFDKRAELEERKKQSSWRNSLGWSRADEAILPVADDSKQSAPNCRLCGASFMALVRKRYKCPLCELAVCGNCFNQKIQLDPVIFTDQPISEWICKACHALVQEEEEHAAIAKAIESAAEQPLVYYHQVVMEVVRTLSRHLPRYEQSVSAADSVADCEAAGKLEASLVELFKNFDIGIKKITALKFESEKETRVQNSVKMALVGFLQENLARFRALQNQRKSLLAQFAEEEKTGKRKQRKSPVESDKGTGPFVATIDPAMAPLAGAKLTFTGSNFKPNTKVDIAGVACRVKVMGPERLIVYSPALESEGLKTVIVTNPTTNESHNLENVLLYSDEYFRLVMTAQAPSGSRAADADADGGEEAGARLSSSGRSQPAGRREQMRATSRSASSPTLGTGTPAAGAIDDFVTASAVPLEEPAIRHIHPAICPVGGGTVLRLTGNHLCSQSAVRIGGKEAPLLAFYEASEGTCFLSAACASLSASCPGLEAAGREARDAVGAHAVEVVNPGGKRCRLDDVLFYTDDPALLTGSEDDAASGQQKSATKNGGRTSSAVRRVSGLFGRASVSASSSPSMAADTRVAADVVMRRTESTDDLGRPGKSRSSAGTLPSAPDAPTAAWMKFSTDGPADHEVEKLSLRPLRSGAPELTGSLTLPSRQRQQQQKEGLTSFGAVTMVEDLSDLGGSGVSGSRPRDGGHHGGPGGSSGHARSASLDHSALARRAQGPSSSSGGLFWNVIDPEASSAGALSTPNSPSPAHASTTTPSPSLSSSSSSSRLSTPTGPAVSRLRWGAATGRTSSASGAHSSTG